MTETASIKVRLHVGLTVQDIKYTPESLFYRIFYTKKKLVGK